MHRTILSLLLLITALAVPLGAAELKGPDVKLKDNAIAVSATVALDERQCTEIEKGVSKNIIIYFDLFREWKSWPDEFVLGKTFTQTLRCDPVKKEYIATSLEGAKLRERRFGDCKHLMEWALTVQEFNLTSTGELEPADYMVKVTVESQLRRLPPFINLLFFFVKEKELIVTADSPTFTLNGRK